MRRYRLSEEAQAELRAIGAYIARESGSLDTALRVLDKIEERFWFLGEHPYAGRRRDDLRPGLRGFPAENYAIIYRIDDDDTALILHVIHQSRDLVTFFQH